MANTQVFIEQTKALVDKLKSTCAQYGLGNDGNEYKIIVQIFLYKFLLYFKVTNFFASFSIFINIATKNFIRSIIWNEEFATILTSFNFYI